MIQVQAERQGENEMKCTAHGIECDGSPQKAHIFRRELRCVAHGESCTQDPKKAHIFRWV